MKRLYDVLCYLKGIFNYRKRFMKALLVPVLLASVVFSGCSSSEKMIVVGAKDFTEQDILGNILTILIEESTDIKVDYKREMSSM